MVRPEKIAEVDLIAEKIKGSQGLVLADFTGLTVASMGEFRVVKNRLARRAAAEADCSALDELLKGPTGIAFGRESPLEPAKVVVDFAKTNENLAIKGGYLDGKLLSVPEVEALSKIPSRDELLGMVMRGMQAPLTGFISVMAGTVRGLATVLDAIAKQKAEGE